MEKEQELAQYNHSDRAHRVAMLVYGGVMLAALGIGLYGLLSLLWLANGVVERGSQIVRF